VRIARTSRRTFYEHFDDLDDCFLALGDAISEYLLGLVAEAASPELPWRERVERAIDVYLQAMAANPGLTRSFLLELFGMGARGLRHRRAVHRRAAEQLRALVEAGREQNPELNPISFETATAIVGGLWELSLLGAEQGRRQDAAELRRTAVQLISDVLTAPRERH
jgi:AcrR family transcriptional regulator